MRENLAKRKLHNGEPIFGVISPATDPIMAELIGLAGFDFYMLDGEHGPANASNAQEAVRACECVGITPLARLRSNNDKLILQFMDTGLMGIMMPGLVQTEDVRNFVNAVKYPPVGARGLGPIRAADYMIGRTAQADYLAFANDQTLVLPQFEDIRMLPCLPEIVRIQGVDGIVIGPRDLAMSMGFYDGPQHPEVQSVIDRVSTIVLQAGLSLGTVAGTGEAAKALVQQGVRICLHSIQGIVKSSAKSYLEAARGH